MVYYALVVLAVLAGANAQDSCSKQMELEHRCMLTVETSPEATMIRDRMKQAHQTCAPDYPQECHAQFDAAHDCATSIAKNADNDPLFQESKSKSQPAVDQCFVANPPDVKEGFKEIFMSMKPPHHKGRFHHKRWHHHKRNATSASGESGSASASASASAESTSAESSSSSNETSASSERKHHGGGGRHGGGGHGKHGKHGRHCRPHRHHGKHHGPRNFTSGESNSNETSGSGSASKEHRRGGWSGGRSGGRSGSGESGESSGKGPRSQCRKTKEQKQCIKDELKKLGQDSGFIDVMNTLMRQKKKCKQIVNWSCSAKCPKKQKCIFKATKPCRQAFMERMKTCLQEKGFTLPPFMMRGDHTGTFTTPLPVTQ